MSRLVVISNRLPFSVKREGTRPYELAPSSGGLVSALSSYLERRRREEPDFECVWMGWPGASIEPQHQASVRDEALKEHRAYPVFLDDQEMDAFYHGFCNSTIWPLLHYFPSYALYSEEQWQTYRRVNQTFCDAALELLRPGDVVWVHDYQLLLLPKLLRGRGVACQLGFFLHVPFPSYEVFRQLPTRWRRELLEGMLGADLVGFHTHTANFDVQVLEGKMVVEVRNAGVNKGTAALTCLSLVEPDFVLAAGDDQTDEDLFRALPRSAFTVRVGIPHSHAAYHLKDHVEVRALLAALGEAGAPG